MKFKKIMLSFILSISVITGCATKPKEDIKDIASNFVQELAEEKIEGIKERFSFDSAMSKVIDEGILTEMIKQNLTPYGKLVEIKDVSEENNLVKMKAVFEEISLIANVSFNGKLEIQGVSVIPEAPEKVMPEGVEEKEVVLKINDTQQLGGTLTLPSGKENVPVVILVQGSGASDRDETIVPNTPFKDIAWQLAQRGIASYRYDKRSFVYGSDFQTNTTYTVKEETIEDAVNAVTLMSKQERIDQSKIYVLGHSLGGYLMPRIAQQSDCAGYILAAGPVTSLTDLILEQVDYLSNLDGTVSIEEKQAMTFYEMEVDKIKNLDGLAEDTPVLGSYKAYWEDLANYQPLEVAKLSNQKFLVLQGEEDYQVPMREFNQWKEAFGTNPNWTFKSYSGLTHLFMPGSLANGSADYLVPSEVDSRMSDDIAAFILK